MSNPRLRAPTLLCLLPLVPITLRLGYLQVLQHGKMAERAAVEVTRESVEIVLRGAILDREGRPLAQSLPSWTCFIDPSVVASPRSLSVELGRVLRADPASILRKSRARSRFAVIKERLDLEQARAVQALKLEGVGLLPEEQRYYPNGDLARGVLGMVGKDGEGLAGLERVYDKRLRGQARKVKLLRDGTGRSMDLDSREEAAAPESLTLTIDRNIQHLAETAMMEGVALHHPEKALVLVQDPRSGEILALASYPGDPLKNPAMQDTYEPGSTYKLFTMAGVLEAKLAKPEETIDAEGGKWEVAPNVVIKDDEPHSILTLSQAIEESSNISMAKLGLKLGPERFYKQSRAFGFGSKTGLAFPGESAGILKPPSQLTRVTLANNSFGQGLSVTPLQLLCAYSAIANGGTLLEPRLALPENGADDPIEVRRVADPGTIRSLTAMMEGVVERGTGGSARMQSHRVAGKTGTAQKHDPATGKYAVGKYIASFAGFAPVSDPRWTILVIMDTPKHGYHGSETAAPIFAKILRQMLAWKGVKPDRETL